MFNQLAAKFNYRWTYKQFQKEWPKEMSAVDQGRWQRKNRIEKSKREPKRERSSTEAVSVSVRDKRQSPKTEKGKSYTEMMQAAKRRRVHEA
jgi:hypothetical protein